MLSRSRYQFLAFPIMHAAGLVLWTLLHPGEGFTPFAWWLVWLPVAGVLYELRAVLLTVLVALPFLVIALVNASP